MYPRRALTAGREINPEILQQRGDLRISAPPGEDMHLATRNDELSPDDARNRVSHSSNVERIISYNTYVARASRKSGFPVNRLELFGFRKICEKIIASNYTRVERAAACEIPRSRGKAAAAPVIYDFLN